MAFAARQPETDSTKAQLQALSRQLRKAKQAHNEAGSELCNQKNSRERDIQTQTDSLFTEARDDIHTALRHVAEVASRLVAAHDLAEHSGGLAECPRIVGEVHRLHHHLQHLTFSLGIPQFEMASVPIAGAPEPTADLNKSRATLLSAIDEARTAAEAYRKAYSKPGYVPASVRRPMEAADARVAAAKINREAQLMKWRGRVIPFVASTVRAMSGDIAQAKAVLALVEDVIAALRSRLGCPLGYMVAARWHAEACRQLLEAR